MINYTAAAAAASSAPANYSNCSNLNYVQSTKTSDVNAEYSNTLDLSACGGHQYLYECAGLSLHNNHNHNNNNSTVRASNDESRPPNPQLPTGLLINGPLLQKDHR